MNSKEREKWDLRQLKDIAEERGMPLMLEVDEALECARRGLVPDNVEALCRELLPIMEDESWIISHPPRDFHVTIMVRLDTLASNILHRYLDHVSDELRDEIEPMLVFHDL